ncbi:phospholipid-transporting ATPase ABCA3-like [Artemia franciscana]|uniref:ABC transporter domain-containing protein n=1 Tax=Artemia franciscana TaxID=6661 RepID=A0AA88IQ05_ARTSF|nr:hypothetical protein QYM36_001155 [Artemia franciscana]KAK2724561.1 hypothetical protein QYM36_001155 [Artemia franciscana]KAK2724562.1 hypothetical protein QYM36_001155 [Artemia franciscana]
MSELDFSKSKIDIYEKNQYSSGWKKFRLLLWKNWVIQIRHPVQTVSEVLLPLVFCLVLVAVRSLVEITPIDVTTWESFTVDELPSIPVNDFGIPNPAFRWPFAYSPNNTIVTEVMKTVAEKLNLQINQEYGFATEDEMVAHILDNYNEIADLSTDFLGGVAFTNTFPDADSFPEEINMKLRLRGHLRQESNFAIIFTWLTEILFEPISLPGPRGKDSIYGGYPGYYLEGFLTLQHAISSSVIEQASGANMSSVDLQMQRFPYPKYVEDYFVLVLEDFLAIILLLGFIYPVMNNVRNIVNEKEARLKESTKIMGLPNWLHWTAWFSKFFMFFLAIMILMTIMQKVPWYGNGVSVVNKTDGTVLFVFYMVYACSTICLCFLISTFFKSGSNAALGAALIWFLTYAPAYFLEYEYRTMTRGSKYGVSIIINTAMAFAMKIVSAFEGTGAGLQWSTFFTPVSADDNFSFGDATIMVAVDGVIYLILALYLEALFPGDFGIPKKWYFPFTKSFWCGNSNRGTYFEESTEFSWKPENCEEEPLNLKAGVVLSGLTKVYKQNKVAVNNVNLRLFEGQITALLGHNGAGKTTTMSMLTGLFPPSSGTAYVNGFDIRTDIENVRGSLGLCPQHDVLFKSLTVEEHLRFFCELKGLDKKLVPYETDRILKMLKLENKRHALAKTLSGGMKRKLSVGIALCAGSKVVMLDEPTSGMDPSSRRAIWDLLQNEKTGRTILLTTHFMDEADFLGDRIAIMSSGKIQCIGSSLFLKKVYGDGYHLTIVKDAECQVEDITTLLTKHVPNVHMDQNVGAELSYVLPKEYSAMFERMFMELDGKKKELRILSYGISATSMEEVFFKTLKQSEETVDPEKYSVRSREPHELMFDPTTTKNTGFNLLIQQLWAMLVKKSLFTLRNWSLIVTQLILPLIVIVVALLVLEMIPGFQNSPSREMSLDSYRWTTTLTKSSSDPIAAKLEQIYSNLDVFNGNNELINVNQGTIEEFFLQQGEQDILNVMQHYVAGAELGSNDENRIQFRAIFNGQPYHTPSLSLNLAHNTLLQYFTNSTMTIKIANAPLPLDERTLFNQRTQNSAIGFVIGYNIAFGYALLASSFIIFLVKERNCNSKHLQFVSGVSFLAYWSGNWIWDMLSFCIPCLGILITFLSFGTEGFTSAEQQGRMFLLFLAFGWAVLPLVYLFSYLYRIPASALTKVGMLFIFTGLATFIIVVVMSIPDLNLVDVSEILDWIFLIWPNYSLGMGFSNLYNNDIANQYCNNPEIERACELAEIFNNLVPPNLNLTNPFANGCCKTACAPYRCIPWSTNYFQFGGYGIGRMLAFLGVDGLIFILLIVIIESRIIKKLSCKKRKIEFDIESTEAEDEDVVKEKEYIIENSTSEAKWNQLTKANTLIVRNLTKIYSGGFLAVDNLSFGVRRGECFGLLGINGAGKTSTFKMLTGDEEVTGGDAFLENFCVRSSIKQVQRRLGYCPQFDALIEEMTGRETLRIFARLRGVPESYIDKMIEDLSKRLLVAEHIDKQIKEMSGGNRRKLSTAVAMVGDPPIIFLDEPTTGMDPVARRHLWNIVTELKKSGKSIVLTSHSMEECEALCTRIAIMVNGTFQCLGSVQHLKSRFGKGYTFIAKTQGGLEEQNNSKKLKDFIEQQFPGSTIKDCHQNLVEYNIPDINGGWSSVFGIVERAKDYLLIDDYSISQTTLEQIFLQFARFQKTEE